MNLSISKKRPSLFCIFILLFVFFMFQQVQSFTLENILSYAFPSSLVVSPKGDLVAWVFNWQGKRNIWAAKAPEYKARQLTAHSLDDGQELGGLAFDQEGKIIKGE
ncbi:unnamed protein product, partial [marine sediment metagenome]